MGTCTHKTAGTTGSPSIACFSRSRTARHLFASCSTAFAMFSSYFCLSGGGCGAGTRRAGPRGRIVQKFKSRRTRSLAARCTCVRVCFPHITHSCTRLGAASHAMAWPVMVHKGRVVPPPEPVPGATRPRRPSLRKMKQGDGLTEPAVVKSQPMYITDQPFVDIHSTNAHSLSALKTFTTPVVSMPIRKADAVFQSSVSDPCRLSMRPTI